MKIYNGNVLAGTEDNGDITPADNADGRQLGEWLIGGVPGLTPVERGETIVEEWGVITSSDPLFGLALLEHFERIGWDVREENEKKTAGFGNEKSWN